MTNHGARIPKKFIGSTSGKYRIIPVKRCPVCLKALTRRNNSGICSEDFLRESTLNYRNQGFYKSRGERK